MILQFNAIKAIKNYVGTQQFSMAKLGKSVLKNVKIASLVNMTMVLN